MYKNKYFIILKIRQNHGNSGTNTGNKEKFYKKYG